MNSKEQTLKWIDEARERQNKKNSHKAKLVIDFEITGLQQAWTCSTKEELESKCDRMVTMTKMPGLSYSEGSLYNAIALACARRLGESL